MIDKKRIKEIHNAGGEFTSLLTPYLKESESECHTDMERLVWWSLFISYICGLASARIGHDAMVDIIGGIFNSSMNVHGKTKN